MHSEPLVLPPTRPAERRALEAARNVAADRILCTTVGRAQAARELSLQRPNAAVCCWFIDDYQRQLAVTADGGQSPNLQFVCESDPPASKIDLAVIPLCKQGEGEFARDVLQAACLRLAIGGVMVAAVDNPNDRWLHAQVAELFTKVTVERCDEAAVYIARKTAEPRRVRDFTARFAFRDRGELIHAISRPGVFAHRRLDAGARQLLNSAEVRAGMHVLDVGCGSGGVALALASREPAASVHAIDSNARAIECTLAGAELDSLTNVTAELNATGETGRDGQFDLVVANPPYFADNRIAAHFLTTAHRALRAGGQVLVVAKRFQWYEEAMAFGWDEFNCWPSKAYWLICATRAASP